MTPTRALLEQPQDGAHVWGEAGHSYSDQASAEGDVRRRYDSIVRSPDAFADDGDAKSSSVVSEDGAEVKEFAFGPQTLNPRIPSAGR